MTKTIWTPSRRDLLRTTAAASALGALGAPALIREANAQSSFNWKRFDGAKLDVMLVKNPRSDLLQAHEKEFTALTGIQNARADNMASIAITSAVPPT